MGKNLAKNEILFDKRYAIRAEIGQVERNFTENLVDTYSFRYALRVLLNNLIEGAFTDKALEVAHGLKEFQGELFKITGVEARRNKSELINKLHERLYSRLNIEEVKRIGLGKPFLLEVHTNFSVNAKMSYEVNFDSYRVFVPIIFMVDTCGIADNIKLALDGKTLTKDIRLPRDRCFLEKLEVGVEYTQIL